MKSASDDAHLLPDRNRIALCATLNRLDWGARGGAFPARRGYRARLRGGCRGLVPFS